MPENATVIKGFVAKGVTDFADVETLLSQMKKVACDCAGRAYSRLVRREVERLFDEIALGRAKRPERESILDAGAAIARDKALYAERTSQPTEYCLYAGVQVMRGTYGRKPSTYFKLVAPNDVFSKQLAKIEGLTPCDATAAELRKAAAAERPTEKGKFLLALFEKYDSDQPLACPLVDYDRVTFEPSRLRFRPRAERIEAIAREQVFNRLLSCYALGREIPPEKLAEYASYAAERMRSAADAADAIEEEKAALSRILPEIDLEAVTRLGTIAVPEPRAGEGAASGPEEAGAPREEEGEPSRDEAADVPCQEAASGPDAEAGGRSRQDAAADPDAVAIKNVNDVNM